MATLLSRSTAILVIASAFLAGGCAEPAEGQPPPAGATARELLERSAVSRLGLETPPPRPELTAGFSQSPEAMLRELAQGEPSVLIPLGAGSSVLRMRFSGGLAAVYRLKARGRPQGPEAEVAAYRVAAALGVDHVPPAELRRMTAAEVERRFAGDAEAWDALRRVVAPAADGSFIGAAIAYDPDLRGLGLGRPSTRAEWRGWLGRGGEIPEASRSLARDLSRMVALDYLIGNRGRVHDRLRGTADGSRALLRNHDESFPGDAADAPDDRLRAALLETKRFSRSMIAGLVALDRAALESLLATEDGPLLEEAQVAGVLERRETLLSYVEALCDRYGPGEVFIFD